MAEFLEKIRENIGKGITTVGAASKELVETARLKAEIAGARRRARIEELGNIVFVMESRDAFDIGRVRERCRAIAGLDERIRELQDAARNVRRRPAGSPGDPDAAARACSCGAEIPGDAKFCGKCGKPVA